MSTKRQGLIPAGLIQKLWRETFVGGRLLQTYKDPVANGFRYHFYADVADLNFFEVGWEGWDKARRRVFNKTRCARFARAIRKALPDADVTVDGAAYVTIRFYRS